MNYDLKNDSAILEIGTKLNNNQYEIIDILGKGGFGIVYKVKRINDLKEFAIKELLISSGSICFRNKYNNKISAKNRNIFNLFKERVKQEVEFLSQNKNKNIIHIYNYFEENNTIYMLMEYIDGYDLEKLIIDRKKIFTENEVLDLLKQLSNAFEKIHSKGVIHRDIKPNNIIRTNDKVYKLIDFTNIKIFLEEDRGVITELMVKAKFFSPLELTSKIDNEIGVYSDIYSLGMTIYCCFSGELQAPDAAQRQIKDSFSEQIDDLNISNKFKLLIKKMTQLDRADRFQSFDEIFDYLEKTCVYSWYKCFILLIKKKINDFFSSFSSPTISFLSIGSLKNKILEIYKESKSVLFLVLKTIGIVFVLFLLYFFFEKEESGLCDSPEKMEKCEQRYREIAFDLNPKISNLDEFEKLIKAKVDINKIKNSDYETALNHLAFKGQYEFVKVLIENGINPNIEDNKGETGLYEAIAYYPKHRDASLKIITLLMNNGADITARRNRNENASILSLAVSHKLVGIVKELVDRGICSDEKGRKYYEKDIFGVVKSIENGHKDEAKQIRKILKNGGC